MLSWAWWLTWLLLPLPWIFRIWLSPMTPAVPVALRIPFSAQLVKNNEERRINTNLRWFDILALIAWILLIAALARPQWVGEPKQVAESGRDLLLSIDLSGSMNEADFIYQGSAINRLTAVKIVANDFIGKRAMDRIGMILFGSKAYIQAPLTRDHTTVKTFLAEAEIGLAGQETAIGDSIGLAMKTLENRPKDSRVLILMTDGANTAGTLNPIKAAELAAKIDLKIYTIGIGADEMIMNTLFGRQLVNPSRDLDEKTMKKIAELTDGKYFRARDIEEFNNIYKEIDKLEPHQSEKHQVRPHQDLFFWPLSLSLLFTFGWITLRTKYS
ncbi:MAG: VWA domain-containing protein [Pseudomonadota bacterium]